VDLEGVDHEEEPLVDVDVEQLARGAGHHPGVVAKALGGEVVEHLCEGPGIGEGVAAVQVVEVVVGAGRLAQQQPRRGGAPHDEALGVGVPLGRREEGRVPGAVPHNRAAGSLGGRDRDADRVERLVHRARIPGAEDPL